MFQQALQHNSRAIVPQIIQAQSRNMLRPQISHRSQATVLCFCRQSPCYLLNLMAGNVDE
jgi:hypothetical protein